MLENIIIKPIIFTGQKLNCPLIRGGGGRLNFFSSSLPASPLVSLDRESSLPSTVDTEKKIYATFYIKIKKGKKNSKIIR